jgi:hypothetical protein
MFISRFKIQILPYIQNVQGKDIRKNTNFKLPNLCRNQTYHHLAAFVFVPSVFGEKFPTGEF